jgi:hypothetical protein
MGLAPTYAQYIASRLAPAERQCDGNKECFAGGAIGGKKKSLKKFMGQLGDQPSSPNLSAGQAHKL